MRRVDVGGIELAIEERGRGEPVVILHGFTGSSASMAGVADALSADFPGRVVSKLDILDNGWDYNFDGDPNIVEVYVKRLRSKLKLPGAGVNIDTVRGAGYRLEQTSQQ